MSDDFTRNDIETLLRELGLRLAAQGVRLNIRLVGGAAIAFTVDDRRVTRDIDAAYAPAAEVEAVAAAMALEHGLSEDWLNSSAKAFIPQGATWAEIHIGEQSDTSVASPETLLAMKLSAARTRDMPDISRLIAKLGLQSPGDAVLIAAEQYGDDDVAYSPDSREDALIVAEEAIRMTASAQPREPSDES